MANNNQQPSLDKLVLPQRQGGIVPAGWSPRKVTSQPSPTTTTQAAPTKVSTGGAGQALPAPTKVNTGGAGQMLPATTAAQPQPTQPKAPGYPDVPRPSVPGKSPVPGAGNGMGVAIPGGSYLGLDFMRQVTPQEQVSFQLQQLLDNSSPYMENARRQGVEMAASRGNLNSSIAAGAAQRAAIEAGLPIAQLDAQGYRDAMSQNFQALSQLRQMRVAGDIQNWLDSESFNRQFNADLAMIPLNNAMDMLKYITQRGYEDPAVYTPDVMSGFSNFFNMMSFDTLSRFFGTGGTGTPTGG